MKIHKGSERERERDMPKGGMVEKQARHGGSLRQEDSDGAKEKPKWGIKRRWCRARKRKRIRLTGWSGLRGAGEKRRKTTTRREKRLGRCLASMNVLKYIAREKERERWHKRVGEISARPSELSSWHFRANFIRTMATVVEAPFSLSFAPVAPFSHPANSIQLKLSRPSKSRSSCGKLFLILRPRIFVSLLLLLLCLAFYFFLPLFLFLYF